MRAIEEVGLLILWGLNFTEIKLQFEKVYLHVQQELQEEFLKKKKLPGLMLQEC